MIIGILLAFLFFLPCHTKIPLLFRPVLDTMYLPGLHNMLSMYQNSIPNSGPVPYQETDATAAKYLSDAQLAAIAAASPGKTSLIGL